VSITIGRTATAVVEAETYPSPYDNDACRKSLFAVMLSLVQTPHPLSPISLSFFANLLRKAEFDEFCSAPAHRMRSSVERISHPICPTLIFPTVLPPQQDTDMVWDDEEELHNEEAEMMDSFCQTEEDSHNGVQVKDDLPFTSTNPSPQGLEASVRRAVESTLQKIFNRKSFSEKTLMLENEESDTEFISAVSSPASDPQNLGGLSRTNGVGVSKRRYEEFSLESPPPSSVPVSTLPNGNHRDFPSPKRTRGDDYPSEGHLSFESMVSDFVSC